MADRSTNRPGEAQHSSKTAGQKSTTRYLNEFLEEMDHEGKEPLLASLRLGVQGSWEHVPFGYCASFSLHTAIAQSGLLPAPFHFL